MKIGFVSRFNPLDKRSWSGTTYYTYQQIKKKFDVEVFTYKWTWLVREWLTMQKSLNKKIFKKQTAVEFLRFYSKYFSKKLEKDLKKRPVDILFVSASSQFIAYVKTGIPIIYMTDATFQQLLGYYPYFSNLASYNLKQGVELDKKAFQKATYCMLASEWCKNAAISDYAVEANKITVTPCGANLDTIPVLAELRMKSSLQYRLLFLGVEWERKGGAMVLDIYRLLVQSGVNPHLYIIGCTPPVDLSADENIVIIPYLDKNRQEDFIRLHTILLQTDLLLLPTRAECAGVVFCEAAAYGIPSITTDTGGVGTYILNGFNGYALPYNATAEEYVEKIISICNNPDIMDQMKTKSRQRFEEVLNWETWGNSFESIVKKICTDEWRKQAYTSKP